MVHNKLDILIISKTKIDSSFSNAEFWIEGYTNYRSDKNANNEGILLYIREDISSTLLSSDMCIDSFYFEINIWGRKEFGLHL